MVSSVPYCDRNNGAVENEESAPNRMHNQSHSLGISPSINTLSNKANSRSADLNQSNKELKQLPDESRFSAGATGSISAPPRHNLMDQVNDPYLSNASAVGNEIQNEYNMSSSSRHNAVNQLTRASRFIAGAAPNRSAPPMKNVVNEVNDPSLSSASAIGHEIQNAYNIASTPRGNALNQLTDASRFTSGAAPNSLPPPLPTAASPGHNFVTSFSNASPPRRNAVNKCTNASRSSAGNAHNIIPPPSPTAASPGQNSVTRLTNACSPRRNAVDQFTDESSFTAGAAPNTIPTPSPTAASHGHNSVTQFTDASPPRFNAVNQLNDASCFSAGAAPNILPTPSPTAASPRPTAASPGHNSVTQVTDASPPRCNAVNHFNDVSCFSAGAAPNILPTPSPTAASPGHNSFTQVTDASPPRCNAVNHFNDVSCFSAGAAPNILPTPSPTSASPGHNSVTQFTDASPPTRYVFNHLTDASRFTAGAEPNNLPPPSPTAASPGHNAVNRTAPPPSRTASPPTLNDLYTVYKDMEIDKRVWEQRLQDSGADDTTMKMSKTKNYKRMQIPAFGPTHIYYVQLASIAIDYILKIKNDPQTWCRVPKNTTQVKKK